MNNELLPIGTLIELNDGKKLVIVSYVENAKHKNSYLCGGYPSYFLIDLIPLSKKNEFIKKYKHYNIDNYLKLDSNYKIVHPGYKNNEFYELEKKFKDLNLL